MGPREGHTAAWEPPPAASSLPRAGPRPPRPRFSAPRPHVHPQASVPGARIRDRLPELPGTCNALLQRQQARAHGGRSEGPPPPARGRMWGALDTGSRGWHGFHPRPCGPGQLGRQESVRVGSLARPREELQAGCAPGPVGTAFCRLPAGFASLCLRFPLCEEGQQPFCKDPAGHPLHPSRAYKRGPGVCAHRT